MTEDNQCDKGHNGDCCCNCICQKRIMCHPLNNNIGKGKMSTQMGWACTYFMDASKDRESDIIIFSDSKHGMCEGHVHKNNYMNNVDLITQICLDFKTEKIDQEDYELRMRVATQSFVKYDSTKDTLLHIKRVSQLLTNAAKKLITRANCHDDSKLSSPEKELFDEFTPKLIGTTYGSDEYKENLKGLGVALKHHYKHNSHHPECHKNGVNGMDLFDLLEMIIDWKAATERHADGDIMKSIKINKERFGLSDQLVDVLNNTVNNL